jgi:hypothetical protein
MVLGRAVLLAQKPDFRHANLFKLVIGWLQEGHD